MDGSDSRQSDGLTLAQEAGGTRAVLEGVLGLHNLPKVEATLGRIEASGAVTLDLSTAQRIDTSIAWALLQTQERLEAGGAEVRIEGAGGVVAQILDTVRDALPAPEEEPSPPRGFVAALVRLGETVAGGVRDFLGVLGVLGLFIARFFGAFARPREFRFTALLHHCEAVGLQAVPIVALMAFLIGVVLAFQGAAQLQQFGAEVFVVDLIAISILRELGILLTAIIVAGRSASAFTAAIGSMKMREEIDAMRVLGLDPIELLVLPRLLALVIVLPILGLVADLAGLFGGGLMAWIELGISPSQFRTQLLASIGATQALVGVSKAPVFAVIIALVGCQQGLQVKGDAESLGMRTSRAVVIAIFLVIVVDALFSVFFALWGV